VSLQRWKQQAFIMHTCRAIPRLWAIVDGLVYNGRNPSISKVQVRRLVVLMVRAAAVQRAGDVKGYLTVWARVFGLHADCCWLERLMVMAAAPC